MTHSLDELKTRVITPQVNTETEPTTHVTVTRTPVQRMIKAAMVAIQPTPTPNQNTGTDSDVYQPGTNARSSNAVVPRGHPNNPKYLGKKFDPNYRQMPKKKNNAKQ